MVKVNLALVTFHADGSATNQIWHVHPTLADDIRRIYLEDHPPHHEQILSAEHLAEAIRFGDQMPSVSRGGAG